MLVLSRKKGEKIFIGENIVVIVNDIRGDKVRLAIEAPKEVGVHRSEVYENIQREKAGLSVGEGVILSLKEFKESLESK